MMSELISASGSWPLAVKGKRVLVVEDEYMLAEDLREELAQEGAEVLGPVSTVAEALALLESGSPPGLAILDINLQGEMVYPVAEALRDRGVPFIFATGYNAETLPQTYADVPRLEKPVELRPVARSTMG